MADMVLLPGTTQTAAGYRWLTEALIARGHRSFAVDLPSGLESAHDYAEVVASRLPARLGRPVVIAHSGAGVLLPACAQHLDATHQVWLAAAVADYHGGRSFLTELHEDPTRVFRAEWAGQDPTGDPVLATYFLFHDADLATLRDALPTVAMCDLSTALAESPTIDPAARPSTYIQPRGDRSLRADWMTHVARDRLGVEPHLLDGGHNLHVAHADTVAGIIDRATNNTT